MMQLEHMGLGWLLVAVLLSTAAMMASSTAQADPVQVPAMGVGSPTSAPPATPGAAAGNEASAAPGAGSADTTVPPLHRETLNDCLGDWDTQTHMTKAEWREACQRTVDGTDMGSLDLLDPGYAAADGRQRRHRSSR
jgi:hypothetical protein